MYCQNCGNKISENDIYCSNCGTTINNIQSQKANSTPLILGILAFIFTWLPFISIPLAVVAISIGTSQKNKDGKTTAGIILGIISIILTAIIIIRVVLFAAYFMDHQEEIYDDLQIEDLIHEFHKEIDEYYEKTTISDIKGYSWLTKDNTHLYLNNDNTYIWYKNNSNHEDNFEQGTFKTYKGEEAIKYISTKLKEYGITDEYQRGFFQKGVTELQDYYLLVLNCEKKKIEGQEIADINETSYYYGFYSDSKKSLDLTNLKDKNKISFIQKEKISNIDV